MGQYTSYYLYQRYESRDGQRAIPSIPSYYSIDGDGTMERVIKMENDPNCGYVPPPAEPTYRWYQLPISQDYICENCETHEGLPDNYRLVESENTLCVETSETESYSGEYLTFIALENCKIGATFGLTYSLDSGNTWNSLGNVRYSLPHTENTYYLSDTIPMGSEALLRYTRNNTPSIGQPLFGINSTGKFSLRGNPLSVVYGDDFIISGDTVRNYEFLNFLTESLVVDASKLALPSRTVTHWCYSGMFSRCIYLLAPPSLPATSLGVYCYGGMFQGCTSLEIVPKLPATTLAKECYDLMFAGCTSLTSLPNNYLHAPILEEECYRQMFWGCTNLKNIRCLATDISAHWCLYYGTEDVGEKGLFVAKEGVAWPNGKDGIPNGWTIMGE